MTKHYKIFTLLALLAGGIAAIGCGDDTDNFIGDGGPDGSVTDTNQQPVGCQVGTMMENFDAPVMPAGWTIITDAGSGSGSGSGSGTGSGNGTLTTIDDVTTWHRKSVDTEAFPPPDEVTTNMIGGYFKVGDAPGMNEALETPYIPIGNCTNVSLSFKQYFQDWPANPDERGEVAVLVDSPPWETIKTINTTGYTLENIDLTTYLMGGSNFKVRFLYTDNGKGNWPWFIDDVTISGN